MMNRSLPARALWGLCCVLASFPAAAQIRYPNNPQTQAECEVAAEQWKVQYRREHEAGSRLGAQSDAIRPPQGCFGNDYCRNNFYATKKQLHEQTMQHYRERDRIEREGSAMDRNCRATARANEQQAEAQKRMAEEQRRQQEQQQREALARQQDMQRQQQAAQQAAQQQQQLAQQRQQEAYRQQQADQQRQIAEQQRQAADQQRRMIDQQQQIANQQRAQQINQIAAQQQLAAQLSAMQRDAERAQDRQPRVIAELPSRPYDNAPRLVQTPEMRAQAATEAAQEQERQRRAEAQALRDTLTPQGVSQQLGTTIEQMNKGAGSIDRARQAGSDAEFNKAYGDGMKAANKASQAQSEAIGKVLNPRGDSYERINSGVSAAQKLNSESNDARGNPLAGDAANRSYSAIGALENRYLGDFDRAMAPTTRLDDLNTPAPRPSPPPPPRPLTSLDDLGGPAAPAAQDCKPITPSVDVKPGKPGDRRRHDGRNYECKDGQWEALK